MSEMVERVARALWDERRARAKKNYGFELEPWDNGKIPQANGIFDEARAAIEAMREPTVDMLQSATRTENRRDEGRVEVHYLVVACDIWPKMIDAALKVQP